MGNPLLAAGRLDRRVTIVRVGDESTDSWGQQRAGSAVEIERWASVRPAPGTERFQSAQNAATALWRFVFRWEAGLVDVTCKLRTGDDGRLWDVKSADPIGRREGWEVLAAARMDA
jgi:head-tail adaptor